jgi:hypothetical protein
MKATSSRSSRICICASSAEPSTISRATCAWRAETLQKRVEELARDKSINADEQDALFAARVHAGRLHGAVEYTHGLIDLGHETAAGLGQSP